MEYSEIKHAVLYLLKCFWDGWQLSNASRVFLVVKIYYIIPMLPIVQWIIIAAYMQCHWFFWFCYMVFNSHLFNLQVFNAQLFNTSLIQPQCWFITAVITLGKRAPNANIRERQTCNGLMYLKKTLGWNWTLERIEHVPLQSWTTDPFNCSVSSTPRSRIK
jgi:hypothetical protein